VLEHEVSRPSASPRIHLAAEQHLGFDVIGAGLWSPPIRGRRSGCPQEKVLFPGRRTPNAPRTSARSNSIGPGCVSWCDTRYEVEPEAARGRPELETRTSVVVWVGPPAVRGLGDQPVRELGWCPPGARRCATRPNRRCEVPLGLLVAADAVFLAQVEDAAPFDDDGADSAASPARGACRRAD
jgi:hypothetical protein